MCVAIMFLTVCVFVTSWAVIWSVESYFFALNVAGVSILILIYSYDSTTQQRTVDYQKCFRLSLILLGVLLLLSCLAASGQAAYTLTYGCLLSGGVEDFLCDLLLVRVIYGFAAALTMVMLAAFAFDLARILPALASVEDGGTVISSRKPLTWDLNV